MKKLLILFSFVFLLGSCHNDGPTHTSAEIAAIDAAAASIFFLEYYEVGAASGIYGIAGISGAALAVGVHASANGGHKYGNKYAETGKFENFELPIEYRIQNNPYESVGISHNKGLNYIAVNGGFDVVSSKFLAYDSTTIFNLADYFNYPGSFPHNDLLRFMVGNDISTNISTKDLFFKGYITQEVIVQRFLISQNVQNYITPILNRLYAYDQNNASFDEVIIYINSEISKIVPKEEYTKEEAAELIFLTVYKHSLYYWS